MKECKECKRWEDLSSNARKVMLMLGNFSVTHAGDSVKGNIPNDEGGDTRVYFDAYDLRQIAEACNEVADVLQSNAQAYKAYKENNT